MPQNPSQANNPTLTAMEDQDPNANLPIQEQVQQATIDFMLWRRNRIGAIAGAILLEVVTTPVFFLAYKALTKPNSPSTIRVISAMTLLIGIFFEHAVVQTVIKSIPEIRRYSELHDRGNQLLKILEQNDQDPDQIEAVARLLESWRNSPPYLHVYPSKKK